MSDENILVWQFPCPSGGVIQLRIPGRSLTVVDAAQARKMIEFTLPILEEIAEQNRHEITTDYMI